MCSLSLLVSFLPVLSPQFDSPVEVTDGLEHPSAFRFGDFDGDGQIDMVGSSWATGELRFWRGDGAGGYGPGETLPVALSSIANLSVGDLDGDGDLDLVAGTPGPSVVWVENLGGGEFAGEMPLAGFGAVLPGSIVRQRIVDFDGNGTNDVLMTFDRSSSGQTSLVLLASSAGGGLFNSQTLITSPTALYDAEAADLDGDGDNDIVVGGSEVGAWFRNDGSGVLTGPIALPLFSGATDEQVAAVDTDGDGNLDLVSLQCFSPLAGTVVYVSKGDGAGSFTPQAPIALFSCISNVVIRDLNGDGRADLLAAAELAAGGRLELALGTAAGPFATPTVLLEGELRFTAAVVGDADGDGVLEVAAGTSGGQVLAREFVPGVMPLTLADDGPELTETVSYTYRDRLVQTADFNGDGNADVCVLAAAEGRIAWWPADGRGGFGSLETIERVSSIPRDIYVADMDGDGAQDVVHFDRSTAQYRWRRGDGAGGFAAQPPVTIPLYLYPASELVDVDGDGLADFTYGRDGTSVQLAWGRNLGGGVIEPRTLVATAGGLVRAPRFRDVNGDGLMDVAFLVIGSAGSPSKFAYYPGTAPGDFASTRTEFELFTPFNFETNAEWGVADMDGDGEVDLVVSVNASMPPARNRLMMYRGLGGDLFGGATVLAGATQSATGLKVADIDGDARPDLIQLLPFVPGQEDGLVWYRNLNGTQFAARRSIVSTTRTFSEFLLGDFDGDGDVDSVFAERLNDAIVRIETLYRGEIGVPYCSASVANSSGEAGEMSASGSALPGAGDLTLTASRLPLQTFGLFLVSRTTDAVFAMNSVGVLCLGGEIGRFTGPGQVVSSGTTGIFSIDAMPNSLPTPQGPAAALAGETWHFQAWHRDIANGQATSNFTRAVSVRFL